MSIIGFIIVVWLAGLGFFVALRLHATKHMPMAVRRAQFGSPRQRSPRPAESMRTTRREAA